MTSLLVDTSVLIKWFHEEGEGELAEARAILQSHLSGDLEAHILDLALYEIGNVLVRALGSRADEVGDQLDDLILILGPPLPMAQPWLHEAARLADAHRLSFYDASWAAAAAALRIPLVSADRGLLAAGLAESAAGIGSRLALGRT